MRDHRFEFRHGAVLRKKLNDLAAYKQISESEVVRRLIMAEHKILFPPRDALVVSPPEDKPARKTIVVPALAAEISPVHRPLLEEGMHCGNSSVTRETKASSAPPAVLTEVGISVSSSLSANTVIEAIDREKALNELFEELGITDSVLGLS